MLLENNIYGLSLIIRGQCEATAVLGYFCDRFESLAAGNIKFEDIEWNVADAVIGARHPQFAEARPPPNILSYIEKADRYLNKNYFEAEKDVVRDNYDWLSEFTHPNFLSNILAFTLDKPNNRYVLRHGDGLQKVDFQLLDYLEINIGLFVFLFDAFTDSADVVGLV